ncbi:hypothetical protein HG374_004933, partial [Escherichia coli]|nr:hypothetical protein [Escherichia coli]
KNNVVPFIRAINVDFMNQYPAWYQEPMSRYA